MSVSLRNGFSLIELLVVSAIIGVMACVGLVSFSSAQVKARDSKRRSDMQEIQQSFEQYYSDNSTYAVAQATMAVSLPGGLPVDPKTGAQYAYANMTVSSYCACAVLEKPTGNSNANCAFVTSNTGTQFCVRNLQ